MDVVTLGLGAASLAASETEGLLGSPEHFLDDWAMVVRFLDLLASPRLAAGQQVNRVPGFARNYPTDLTQSEALDVYPRGRFGAPVQVLDSLLRAV